MATRAAQPNVGITRRGAAEPTSAGEELQRVWDELLVVLEDAAVPGIGIDLDLAVGQALGQVEAVGGGHHSVVVSVGDEDGLLDGRQVGRLLYTPGVDSLQLGPHGFQRDLLVAIVGALLQPIHIVRGLPTAVGRRGEEQVLLGVLERQVPLEYVNDRDSRDLVDAGTAGGAGAGEDHLVYELWLQLHDDLGHHAAERESEQVDLFESERPDEGDGVSGHRLDRVGCRAAGGADPAIVERDHVALGGDPVNDPRIPVVEDASQVVQENERHAAAWPKLAVGEGRTADVDRLTRGVRVGRLRHCLSLLDVCVLLICHVEILSFTMCICTIQIKKLI